MAEIDAFNPNVRTSPLFYLRPQSLYEVEKPYFMNIPVNNMEGLKQTNVSYTMRTADFTDIRGYESLFSVEKHGFAIADLKTSLQYEDFYEPTKITTTYYEEVCNFLKQATGASDVLPFDYQVRRRDTQLRRNARGVPGKAQPFAAVHADQTARAALRRLAYFHPEEATRYHDHRVQIINVWKPLRGPVYDAPLAVCDYRTVDAGDDVPTDAVFPDYLGEVYNFYPNPKHRWVYIDGQLSEEAWLVKCFDSAALRDPTIAQFCPHVSFTYQDSPLNATPRESIEVRTFVFSPSRKPSSHTQDGYIEI